MLNTTWIKWKSACLGCAADHNGNSRNITIWGKQDLNCNTLIIFTVYSPHEKLEQLEYFSYTHKEDNTNGNRQLYIGANRVEDEWGLFLSHKGLISCLRLFKWQKTLLCSTIEVWCTVPGTHNAGRTTGFCLIKIVCRSASHWDSSRNEISKGLNPANLWSCNNEGFPLHFDLFVIKYQMTAAVCWNKKWMSTFIFVWVVTALVNWVRYKIQSQALSRESHLE